MLDQQTQQTNPLGPLASAATQLQPQLANGDSAKKPARNPLAASILDGAMPSDPDTDGRRSYSPAYGSAFNVRQAESKTPATGNPLAEVSRSPAALGNPLASPSNQLPSTGVANSGPGNAQINPLRNIVQGTAPSGAGVVDDSASALIDQKNSTYNPLAQLERMQRSRMMSDLTDPTITDPAVRANAAKALGVMGNPLEQDMKRQQVEGQKAQNESAKMLAELHQQFIAESDPEKQAALGDQILTISGKGRAGPGERLTLPQTRSNLEIDAARERIAGMTSQEIQRRTAKTTNTGRENPDFDPLLERAVTLANRRKYGADDHFDQRQQAQQSAGSDGDVTTRFKSDKAMQGHTLGQQTDQGTEVFDASGRLIGHYR